MKFARLRDGHLIDVYNVPGGFADVEKLTKCLPGASFFVVPDDAVHGAKDNGDGTYTNPEPAPEPITTPQWDEFDFRKRFTRDERKAIMAATKVDADIADFEAMLQTAGRTGTMIKANDALLNEAMGMLELAGLIGPGRAAEILGQ